MGVIVVLVVVSPQHTFGTPPKFDFPMFFEAKKSVVCVVVVLLLRLAGFPAVEWLSASISSKAAAAVCLAFSIGSNCGVATNMVPIATR